MHNLLDHAERLLIDRQVFGIVMVVTLVALLVAGRLFLRDILNDAARGWRLVARAWLVALGCFTLWTSIFDDWIQLIGEPFRRTRQWASERVIADPIAPDLRAITLGLLVVAVVLTAAIVARHIGSYGLQITALVIFSILWIPLFVLRQRLDILVHDGVSDRIANGADFAGLMLFWMLRTALSVTVTALSFAILTLIVAPVMTLVLDLLRVRTPRVTREADDFFTALHQQAGEYDDEPLKARWRPIHRPS